jgi:hypothetical protein
MEVPRENLPQGRNDDWRLGTLPISSGDNPKIASAFSSFRETIMEIVSI